MEDMTAAMDNFALRCKKIKNAKSGASVESKEVKQLRSRLALLEEKLGADAATDLE